MKPLTLAAALLLASAAMAARVPGSETYRLRIVARDLGPTIAVLRSQLDVDVVSRRGLRATFARARVADVIRVPGVEVIYREVSGRTHVLFATRCARPEDRLLGSYIVETTAPERIRRQYGSGGYVELAHGIALDVSEDRLGDLLEDAEVTRIDTRCLAPMIACDASVPWLPGFTPRLSIMPTRDAVGDERAVARDYALARRRSLPPAIEAKLRRDPRVSRVAWLCGEKLSGCARPVANSYYVTFFKHPTDAVKADLRARYGVELDGSHTDDVGTWATIRDERVRAMAGDRRVRHIEPNCYLQRYW